MDEKFKKAIEALSDFESQYHPRYRTIDRMERAEMMDKSLLKVLNKLKENFRVREELALLLCQKLGY